MVFTVTGTVSVVPLVRFRFELNSETSRKKGGGLKVTGTQGAEILVVNHVAPREREDVWKSFQQHQWVLVSTNNVVVVV